MADNIQATPRNYVGGLLTDAYKWMQSPERTQQMQGFAGLLGTTGLPQTIERLSYADDGVKGFVDALTNVNKANVPLLKPETADALMTVAPFAGPAARGAKMLPKNLPVGMSIKPVDDVVGLLTPQPMQAVEQTKKGLFNTFDESTKYHQKVPEVKNINIANLKRMNSGEVADVSDEVAAKMDFSKPIQVSVFSDGEMRIVDGHHRVAAAKKLGMTSLPVELQAINARGKTLNKLAQESVYPQQSAFDLAQQRAALPKEQGGLGLLSSNTPAERAKAMGFDIESLHGTSNPNIQKFDPSLVGTKAGNAFDNYMWSTTNPDAATGYSLNMKSYEALPEVVNLKEQKNDILKQISKAFEEKDSEKVGDLRKQLNSIADKESTIFDTFKQGQIPSEGSTVYPLAIQRQEFMPYDAGGKSWMKANRPAIEQSQDLGYQGVQINNVIDNPNSFMGSAPATTFATENPDLLRSRFAAFDPFRRTAATAAAMGVAAPDLLAQEQPVITQQQIDDEMMKYGLIGR